MALTKNKDVRSLTIGFLIVLSIVLLIAAIIGAVTKFRSFAGLNLPHNQKPILDSSDVPTPITTSVQSGRFNPCVGLDDHDLKLTGLIFEDNIENSAFKNSCQFKVAKVSSATITITVSDISLLVPHSSESSETTFITTVNAHPYTSWLTLPNTCRVQILSEALVDVSYQDKGFKGADANKLCDKPLAVAQYLVETKIHI